ncbi:MAG: PEP-CTERM sorting domain-containing protein [Bryobacteraceae bacterium]|nr:PEP-CTERM sorting domain-containing protein [Bryobacteraceae bacterium]
MKKLFALLAGAFLATTLSAAPIGYSVNSNDSDRLYRIDLTTGVATDLGALTFGDAEGLEIVNGTIYGIGGSTNEFWNLSTPPGSLIGATGTRNGTDAGLGYSPATGTLYNLNGTSGLTSLYTVNMATGATSLVGSSQAFGDNLAINGSGAAYAIDGIFADSLYSIDLSTGSATLVGSLGLGNISVQFGSDFDEAGILWALSSNGEIYQVNTLTGAATFQALVRLDSITGATLSGFEGLAVDGGAAAIPEPATYLGMFGALTALALLRRRRSN